MSQAIAGNLAEKNDITHVETGGDEAPAFASDVRTKESLQAHGGIQKY